VTNSVAILSDSIHDVGDAASIGISYFLEKKSRKKADAKHTYGYIRYSVLGGVITTVILMVGSVLVIISAVKRLVAPTQINYDKMIVFAVVGVVLNLVAACVTREGDSINQKSVNLHMLEDVLGWIVVLVGAVVMRFTDICIIDPLMSIGVSVFILINTFKNLGAVLDIFLEKTPHGVDIDVMKQTLMEIEGIDDVHHIHVWSIDGYNNYATMHIVTKLADATVLKEAARQALLTFNVCHTVIETEYESCDCTECETHFDTHKVHHHHHH